jgi:hypothetical protein
MFDCARNMAVACFSRLRDAGSELFAEADGEVSRREVSEQLEGREECVGKGESCLCCSEDRKRSCVTPSYVGGLGAPTRWVNESKRFSGV